MLKFLHQELDQGANLFGQKERKGKRREWKIEREKEGVRMGGWIDEGRLLI